MGQLGLWGTSQKRLVGKVSVVATLAQACQVCLESQRRFISRAVGLCDGRNVPLGRPSHARKLFANRGPERSCKASSLGGHVSDARAALPDVAVEEADTEDDVGQLKQLCRLVARRQRREGRQPRPRED